MEKDSEYYNSALIFLSLNCLELAWNSCRTVLITISLRYYFEIIKEVRRLSTVRLSDFKYRGASENDPQEFHEEMMNEYPGHGHKENVKWYCVCMSSFLVTMALDIFALLSVYFKNNASLMAWFYIYLIFTVIEAAATVFMMRKYTNQTYFKRKWRHCLFTSTGCTVFRLYLFWVFYGLPKQ